MLHWEGCEVTLLVGTRVCIGWLRSILREIKLNSSLILLLRVVLWYSGISVSQHAVLTATVRLG